mgnify:CR=1 FL=1
MTLPTPFNEARAEVRKEHLDYNGHMNVGFYHVLFDQASEPFFQWLGFTDELRSTEESSTFALESHLNFLREVKLGDRLRFEARLLDFDGKRVHFYQEMFHVEEGYLAASHESITSYMNMRERRTAVMPDALQARLGRIREAHASLARPWQVGHVIAVKGRSGAASR